MLKELKSKHRKEKLCYRLLVQGFVLSLLVLCLIEITNHSIKKEEAMQWYTKSMGEQEVVYETSIQIDRKENMEKEKTVYTVKKREEVKKEEENLFTKKEIEILERIVEAETTGGDFRSKVLVADVVLNRVKSEKFPNTIEEVVFQKTGNIYQFSPVYDRRYYSVSITKETKKAVSYAINHKDQSKGALYFANRSYANEENMRWFDQNLQYLFHYGGHEFFKEK